MDKLIEKIKKLLSKHDVSQEKIDAVVEELKGEEPKDDPTPVDDKSVDTPVVDEGNPVDEPTPSATVEEGPVNDGEVPPVAGPVDAPVPPVDTPTTPNPDGSMDVDPNNMPKDNLDDGVTPPANPEVPATQDDARMTELLQKVDEQNGVIETLKSEISSLKEALVEGGIMVKESATGQIGADGSKLPANDPIDDPMDKVLNEINNNR